MSISLRAIDKKDKGLYFQVLDNYWDPQKQGPRQRTLKTIGYLSKYMPEFDENDPDAKAEAERIARSRVEAIYKEVLAEHTPDESEEKIETIHLDMSEKMSIGTSDSFNVGYGILKRIYKELELDKFWKIASKGKKFEYDPDKIFQLLVFGRIIIPGSKKYTYEHRNTFFEDFGDFSLDNVYKALDLFAANEETLQKWIYDHSVTKYHRDLSIGYFDCTNYYFDISKPDVDELDDEGNIILKRYRKNGPDKNNRKDPIVEMGLLMDKTGIPLAYDLFPGNESEKVNMLPLINRARTHYGLGRIIIVADRGLNTSDNIYKLNGKNDKDDNPRDGYVYGQTVRGADAEFKKWAIDPKGYVDTPLKEIDADWNENEDDIHFRHKSRIYPKTIYINRKKKDGSTVRQKITVDQKQMVYYSAKYAKKQKMERTRIVERAKDLIDHPKKYDNVAAKGASGYVMNLAFDKDTGEVLDKNLQLDEKKIHEEEKYDGFYSIVTSELKMSDVQMREIYRGLIHIEDTFKLTKSELDTRPIFCSTNDHIDAHFTTCFTATVLIRLLEKRLGEKYPVGKILESLRNYNCTSIDKNLYSFSYYDAIMHECSKEFETDLSHKHRKRADIRRILKY
jgi:transposase